MSTRPMSTAIRRTPDRRSGAGGTPDAGYRHRRYAQSFFETGTCVELPACGGWVVRRTIPRTRFNDAMGCYPLFCCGDWSALPSDLASLEGLISLTLVTDPFANVDIELLSNVFDVVRPFKQHHVAEAARAEDVPTTRHHCRNVRRARRAVRVEECDAAAHLDEFVELYGVLRRRHRISGISAFSRDAIERQLQVPGIVGFRATAGGALAGIHLWYVDGDVAFAHLGATNALGYATMASYALYAFAIERLSARVRWLDLGAAPGIDRAGQSQGLDEFKRGFATTARPVFLCGKIFDRERYDQLAGLHDMRAYFPAYRADDVGG
jgi:Acetyltransferase (GNAT) domain